MELQHLSHSSISTYLLCPRAWRFKYIDKVETPKSASLVFGSAFHNAVEEYLRSQCKGQPPDILSKWQQAWQAESASPGIDWGDSTPEQLSNDGVRMLSHKETLAALAKLQPLVENGEPVIERRIELRVPGVPVPIIGYIDMIDHAGIPHDFKTSARAWTPDKLDSELQPLFYIAAMAQAGSPLNPMRQFRHVVFVKTKTPQVQVLESMRSAGELLWLLDMVHSVWRGIDAGAYPPNTNSWKCSAKFCECWQRCRGRVLCTTTCNP